MRIYRVRMAAKMKAWIAVKKKRGGQPGNRNRRVHGLYSAATRARAAEIRAIVAQCDAVIARVGAHVALQKMAAREAARRIVDRSRRRRVRNRQGVSWPTSCGPSRVAAAGICCSGWPGQAGP